MAQVLEGIKVVDLSRFIAGPYCSMLLGDMGADVIKIEKPHGDEQRHLEPTLGDLSTYFMIGNRNKRSLTLNMKDPEGKKILRQILSEADVVVENFRPGVMERLGFGYEQLREINPRIIMTSISGFGQSGPMALRPAFDSVAQATGGLMAVTGDGRPTLAGTWVGDYSAGLYAAFGTMLALFNRERTGEGQHVDIALLDSIVSWQRTAVPDFLLFGKKPSRNGSRNAYHCPIGSFQSSDGYLFITAATDAQYAGVCKAAGHPEWLEDERLNCEPARMANTALVDGLVEEWTKTVTTKEAIDALVAADVPCAPINDIEQVLANEQVQYRENVVWVKNNEGKDLPLPGITVKLSETPGTVRLAPPSVGEYNLEYYGKLGYTEEQIQELYDKGII